jgi:hypothetical protein
MEEKGDRYACGRAAMMPMTGIPVMAARRAHPRDIMARSVKMIKEI